MWNWLNVLLFDIANQRLPESIIGDSINKPWRPLLLAIIPLVLLASCILGSMPETVAMIVLGYMYNDLSVADEHYRSLGHCNSRTLLVSGVSYVLEACVVYFGFSKR